MSKAFQSIDRLIAATEEVVHILAIRPVALGGGLAMQFHGSPRLTADVNLFAQSTHPLAWPERVSFGGIRGRASNGIDVNVIVRADEWAGLYREALGEARLIDQSPIPVITAEWLVPIKMIAGRPSDESDVFFLLQSETFDVAVAERIVRAHLGAYGVAVFRRLLRQAEWLRERER